MGSLVEGYNNDIFISYRQNDNKVSGSGDGWVSEFVNNLSNELETTVKGKITIYFDRNPHDGLLETHNVDESLLPKLRSLIFIPIVSQTYCDPQSFAWCNEFLPFISQAAHDKFGLSIKLPNGNVASRVLPVRIHELDPEDVKMLEDELRGKLRPVDFIFKSPGVNRPLRAVEENPLKNSNHSIYRDQINKTANAVKEMINGFKVFERPAPQKTQVTHHPPLHGGISSHSVSSNTIVVLPFRSGGSLDEELFFGEGVAEEILNLLSHVRGLKVVPRASSFSLNLNGSEAMEKFGAGKIVEGRVENKDGKWKLFIEVTDSQNGSKVLSESYEKSTKELPGVSKEIALMLLERLFSTVRETDRDLISRQSTQNPVAYMEYLKGRYHWYRKGEGLMKSLVHFQKAAELDCNFSLALAGIANTYALLGFYELVPFSEALNRSKESAIKALEIDPSLTEAWSALAFVNMSHELHWPEAEQYFNKAFAIKPGHPSAPERFKRCFNQITALLREAEAEPLTTIPFFLHAYSLLHRGKFEEALKESTQAISHDPNSFMTQRALGLSYLGLEKYEEAITALQKAASLSNRHHWLLFELMGAYMLAGKIEEARGIMDEVLAGSNALPSSVYQFFFPSAKA